MVLERNDSTEGQIPRHGGIVQKVALQRRLKARTKMTVPVSAEKETFVFFWFHPVETQGIT